MGWELDLKPGVTTSEKHGCRALNVPEKDIAMEGDGSEWQIYSLTVLWEVQRCLVRTAG